VGLYKGDMHIITSVSVMGFTSTSEERYETELRELGLGASFGVNFLVGRRSVLGLTLSSSSWVGGVCSG
jgi:hypothetical protein